MLKSLFIVLAVLVSSCSAQCVTEFCRSRNPPTILSLINPDIISQVLEQEVKRQFWYFLRNSELIDQTRLETSERLVIYFFHQNKGGTFLTICSWYYRQYYSQVNTLVRVGSGFTSNRQNSTDSIIIDPFLLLLDNGQWSLDLTLTEQGVLQFKPPQIQTIVLEQSTETCSSLSDSYLRTEFNKHLQKSAIVSSKTFDTEQRQYTILIYSNEQGTYMAVTSCQQGQVSINTFVRLGSQLMEQQKNKVLLQPSVIQSAI